MYLRGNVTVETYQSAFLKKTCVFGGNVTIGTYQSAFLENVRICAAMLPLECIKAYFLKKCVYLLSVYIGQNILFL